MDVAMKVSTSMIKNMDSGYTLGLMAENTKATGKTVNDREEENTFSLQGKADREFGIKIRESDGLAMRSWKAEKMKTISINEIDLNVSHNISYR